MRSIFSQAATWYLTLLSCSVALSAEVEFLRAVNINGPALKIDGRAWDAGDAPGVKVKGKAFENQRVLLLPPTDAERAQMIRSSRWGDEVEVTIEGLPAGTLQVALYVWEDNHNEKFSITVNGKVVVPEFHSGTAGAWKRLGPFLTEAQEGKVTLRAKGPSHGAANLSGVEVWRGEGVVPGPQQAAFAETSSAKDVAFFESKVRPVLAEHCYECHSAKAQKVKGRLVLDSRAGVRKGGDTGPLLTPGNPDASLLIEAVRHKSEDVAMPPKKKLPPEHIAALVEWVKRGAPDPRDENTLAVVEARSTIDFEKGRQWWSFQPLQRSAPPVVRRPGWQENWIDAHLLAEMEKIGLEPAAPADAATLLRRVTFTLTGLPPSPEERAAFLQACEAETGRKDGTVGKRAYVALIDRLLGTREYAERWARHWLDVVRYADTAGDNSDFPIPQMAAYRDWVVSAIQADMPYDRFVQAQLAGDLMPWDGGGAIVATGYLANSRRFGSRVDDYPWHLTVEDTIDNFGRTFLGLTINCARCHDHKFDPISAEDYYGLYGVFASSRYPWPGIELDQRQRDLVPLVEPAKRDIALQQQRARDEEGRKLEKTLKKLEDELKNKQGEEKKAHEQAIAKAREAVETHASQPAAYTLAYAMAEGSRPADAAIQMKGDPAKPGKVVSRRFLTVLGGAALKPPQPGSGRAQLAEALFRDAQPLVARVIVNRVWLHHFGKGLVTTPNDFGRQGRTPTHPALLDALAADFIDSRWSLKALHRRILLSQAYQMASRSSPLAAKKDATNEKLSYFPRQRLDAESIRDSLLALGGNLDRSPAGQHPFPPQRDWKYTQHNPFKAVYESDCRSLYLMTQRIQRHPYLAIFDGADPSASTPQRTASTTPLQALFLLNDPFVHRQATGFAKRLLAAASDDTARIRTAFLLALAREPYAEEIARVTAFLDAVRAKLRESGGDTTAHEQGAWEAYARALFRVNEFVYLD